MQEDTDIHDDLGNGIDEIIINKISNLKIDCPECKNIISEDEQYCCTTCWGEGEIYVLSWLKEKLTDNKVFKLLTKRQR